MRRRLDRRSYIRGYQRAMQRARQELAELKAEQAKDLEAIKRDLRASREHLHRAEMIDCFARLERDWSAPLN